jgi:hypothetical protein
MGVWSGSVRVDIAVINGELSGYELKSDSDTLARLPQQIELYGRVFDRMTLVIGRRHLRRGRPDIPTWWGIMEAVQNGDMVQIRQLRKGRRNPSPDPFLTAQLLWRDEAVAALDRFGIAKGFRAKAAPVIHQRLADEVPFEVLAAHVRTVLKRRCGWLGQPVSDKRHMPVEG